MKKSVLRNFESFTGKHLYQSGFLNKVAGLAGLIAGLITLEPLINYVRFKRCLSVA